MSKDLQWLNIYKLFLVNNYDIISLPYALVSLILLLYSVPNQFEEEFARDFCTSDYLSRRKKKKYFKGIHLR